MLHLILPLLLAGGTDFLADEAGPHTTDGVMAGFGRLVGSWSCDSEFQPPQGGDWQKSPQPARWDFHFALDGAAVQDVWRPGVAGAPVGTNLRTYDPESDRWQMVWATATQARFDHFDATVIDGNIIMTGERWARGALPAHHARITFHEIGEQSFEWRYEASGTGAEGTFGEQSRISCRRL